ncbi:TLR13 [Mytilus edulis]|uniref:TLR13 n=1 Tax=Mytilus edulis TaxID=6550 RepID=A0A8S3QH70_MYTED|nr:TLR13 [Mytilus edulis]
MNTVIILTIFVNLYGCIPSGTTLRCNYFEDKTFNLHANCSNRNLTNIPTVASNVVALDLSCNCIKVVENKTFLYLKVLRELNLSSNKLEWLDQGAFLGLKNLQSLILRKNQLAYNSEHFANSIFKPLKSLTYLDLTLQRLDFTKMKTSWFSKYVISDLTNLHSIGIDIVASATDYIFREGFLSLTKLTAVKSDTLQDFQVFWDNSVFNSLKDTGLQNLFLNENDIEEFNSDCKKPGFELPSTLKYLDFSSNKLTSFCLSMPYLSSLNLEQNNLRDFLKRNVYYRSYPTNLTEINLSSNNLDYLNVSLFNGHRCLRNLNLSNNFLTDINFDTSHLISLKVLDLSNNRIQKFSQKSMEKLNTIFYLSDVRINLSGNILQCSCDAIQFIEWLLAKSKYFYKKNKTKCRFSNETEILLTTFRGTLLQLKKSCKSYLVLIICTSMAILLVIIILTSGLVYRYRWTLRYIYFMTKNKYIRDNLIQNDDQNYTYDAFISYSIDEQDFIIKECIPILEGGGLARLCIHKRDFMPGNEITHNITNSIHESRNVICIITKSFLESYYCMFEFNMARMESIYARSGQNILFLVFYENLRPKDLPLVMLELVQNDSYIEYPNDEEGNIIFWEKLKEALK